MILLQPEEPVAGPWRVEAIGDVVRSFFDHAGPILGGPLIVAIDGRSASGKTTLAQRIADATACTSVVHTDDIAWNHSRFGWADLMAGGVLEPLRRGHHVSYRPPAWNQRSRSGSVDVPAESAMVVIEGVGAARRDLAQLLDATIWVKSDLEERARRETVRVDAGETTAPDTAAWMEEEDPFVAQDRPWERATLIVAGLPVLPHDPVTEIVVADRPSG